MQSRLSPRRSPKAKVIVDACAGGEEKDEASAGNGGNGGGGIMKVQSLDESLRSASERRGSIANRVDWDGSVVRVAIVAEEGEGEDAKDDDDDDAGAEADADEAQAARAVQFRSVEMREYNVIVGYNPSCSCGPPMGIGWEYNVVGPFDLTWYESTKPFPMRTKRELLMPKKLRQDTLQKEWQFHVRDVADAVRRCSRVKRQRQATANALGWEKPKILLETAGKRISCLVSPGRTSVRDQVEALLRAHYAATSPSRGDGGGDQGGDRPSTDKPPRARSGRRFLRFLPTIPSDKDVVEDEDDDDDNDRTVTTLDYSGRRSLDMSISRRSALTDPLDCSRRRPDPFDLNSSRRSNPLDLSSSRRSNAVEVDIDLAEVDGEL